MCGIAGFTGPREEPERLLAAMSVAMEHRGADGGGRPLADGIGLAIRRLAIIDVEGGHQPYASEDGGVVAVFNGEIYGFRELRRSLETKGHRFRTATDGEVIVHAYEEYGLGF